MIVENVLEHTVVNSAERGGAADRAGVVANSLLIAVSGEETVDLTHEEVILRLKQPARPLLVRLRRLSADVLGAARDRMRALVEPPLAPGADGAAAGGAA